MSASLRLFSVAGQFFLFYGGSRFPQDITAILAGFWLNLEKYRKSGKQLGVWEAIDMDPRALPAVLLVSIPEEIMITALGLLLFGIRLRGRILVLIGIIQGLVSYVVGQLPILFGLHVIAQVFLFALVITLILQLPYRVSLTAMMVSATIYVVLEAAVVPLLLVITKLPLTEILTDARLQLLCLLPQGLLMLILIYIVYRHNIKLLNLQDLGIVSTGKWWQA